MKTRKHTRRGPLLLAAVAAVALMGGSAFTASNSGMATSEAIGYGETDVTGATVNSLTYTYSDDKSEIESVALALDGETIDDTVELVLHNEAGSTDTVDCGTGQLGEGETTYTCTPPANYRTSSLDKTAVVVTNPA